MVSRTTARNTAQSPGNAMRFRNTITLSSTGAYTVPANTITRITDMRAEITSVGTDTTVGLAILRDDGTTYTMISVPVSGTAMEPGITTASLVVLTAGEKLTVIGDSGGVNSTADVSATIEEFAD